LYVRSGNSERKSLHFMVVYGLFNNIVSRSEQKPPHCLVWCSRFTAR